MEGKKHGTWGTINHQNFMAGTGFWDFLRIPTAGDKEKPEHRKDGTICAEKLC